MFLKNSFVLLIALSAIACTDKKNPSENPQTAITDTDSIRDIDPEAALTASEDFTTFLDHFSTDSVFQLSRVTFPLTIKQLGDGPEEPELASVSLAQKDYLIMDFAHNPAVADKTITQNIKINGDTAVVEIRGVETDFYTDFIFVRHNGKWRLKTWNDMSL